MKTIESKIGMLFILLVTSSTFNAIAQNKGDHQHGKRHHGRESMYVEKRGENAAYQTAKLESHLYRITQPDSTQQKKMKPIIEKTSKRLMVLHAEYQNKEKNIMDSLQMKLKPILREDQLKRLKESKLKRGERKS